MRRGKFDWQVAMGTGKQWQWVCGKVWAGEYPCVVYLPMPKTTTTIHLQFSKGWFDEIHPNIKPNIKAKTPKRFGI